MSVTYMTNDTENNFSTRDRILHEAFLFYKEPHFSGFTLAQVASKVGITKTAIYRHFSSKNDLQEAMKQHFFNTITVFVNSYPQYSGSIDSSTNKGKQIIHDGIKQLMLFFADKPEYIGYLLFSFVSCVTFENELVTYLHKQGVTFLGVPNTPTQNESRQNCIASHYVKTIYVANTIVLTLLKHYDESAENIERRATLIADYITSGNSKAKQLSKERFTELNRLCEIDENELPPENRIFSALASVICKHGIPGVTVEKLADELGLAKSSLYSYFANKNELIRKMIKEEMVSYTKVFASRNNNNADASESSYIFLKSLFNYLTIRPEVLPVFGWLRIYSGPLADDLNAVLTEAQREIGLKVTTFDLGTAVWLSSLSITILLQGKRLPLTEQQLTDNIIQLHQYIIGGIFSYE